MNFKKVLLSSLLVFSFSCNQDKPNIVKPVTGHGDEKITFKLKIENLSKADSLKLSNGKTESVKTAKGLLIVFNKENPVFTIGKNDTGNGLEALAEDGETSKLETYLKDKVVSVTAINPLKVGESAELSFSANSGSKLAFFSMFAESNDLFYSFDDKGIELFDKEGEPIKGDLTDKVMLWDAGTEENQEPALGADQAPRQKAPNTGKAETKAIEMVKDAFSYPKTSEVLKVTLTNDDVHDEKK